MDLRSGFERFNDKRILVIGDVMVDAYIHGKVSRISPEAPVPIVNYDHSEDRLGGAANVALNLVALGARPIICSVIGNDVHAEQLLHLLKKNKISAEGLVQSTTRKTTVKTRVIGNNQQLLRIDSEQTNPINADEENELIDTIVNLIASGIDAIIFEDYNKGVLTKRVINEIVEEANRQNVITTVDPKKDNFLSYKGVTLFKPNLKELKEGLGMEFRFPSDQDAFLKAVDALEAQLKNEISFVTLSEHGVFIRRNQEQFHDKAHLRNIADVSGAGDTVIAVATLCLVAGFTIEQLAQIANIAGGLVCEKIGVVSIEKNELLEESIKLIGS
jgi:D-glycero-beta-D-manno-heptose-7-phosphate kinase